MTGLEFICLQELRKTAQNCQNGRYLRRDMKQGPQEYKAGAINTRVQIRKMERIKKRDKYGEGTMEINKDENVERGRNTERMLEAINLLEPEFYI